MMLFNNTVINDNEFSETVLEQGLSIYEVIRIFKKKPIFLKDNIMRLSNSLKKSNIEIDAENLNISDKLERLIELEHMTEGNIKYVLHFTNGNTPDEYIFRIPHTYPSAQHYEEGVDTITYQAIREKPEVKYINPDLRTQTNRLILENQAYEVLLVDFEGYITEGSRSNVFFIKDSKLYTAPSAYVLPGTSRKRVFDICKKQGVEIIETRVAADLLFTFDAAFLTGTSPLILPIRKVNQTAFDVHNHLLKKLMNEYFSLLQNVF